MARCCCSFWEDADDADNADFDKDDDDNNIDDDDNNDDDDDEHEEEEEMRRIYKQRRNPWQRFQFSPAQLYPNALHYIIMWTSRHQKEPHSRGKWTLSIYGPLVEIFFSFQKRDFFHFGIEYITGKIPLFRMNSFYWKFPAHPPDTIVRDISWPDRMEPKIPGRAGIIDDFMFT